MLLGTVTKMNFSFVMLAPEEAGLLANALADIFDQYQINIEGPGGVWLGLMTAAGLIYGPRYFAFQQLVRATRATPVVLAASPAEVAASGQAPINFANAA